MFGQTFATSDLGVIGFLVVLEALLSADNALVLAIMVRHLPKELQRKALLYGLGGAFVFRFVAILLATQIIQLWWLQALGAAYLLYLPLKHFYGHSRPKAATAVGAGFWRTVVAVEVTDIAFAIDSVLAGVAMVRSTEKIWVVYTGAILGVIALRFAAGFFIGLLERFPVLDHVAYVLVGWVGVKLAFMAGHHFVMSANAGHPAQPLGWDIPEMSPTVFWSVLAAISAVGVAMALRQARADSEAVAPAEHEGP